MGAWWDWGHIGDDGDGDGYRCAQPILQVIHAKLALECMYGGGDDSCLEVLEFVSHQFESHPKENQICPNRADLA